MKLQMSFGENLINLRKQKGWSQDDLADNLNLSRQAISKWENETSKPDIDNIEKISKLFSVTIDDLLNNDVVKDKAVTLNVKKQEKKEKTITIVKCMIIAVIILYIINVIFKFASLLIIVNGIQKYANLSNYHYIITTYDENGLAEKEECWFKDGVSKNLNVIYEDKEIKQNYCINVDFNKNYGYIEDFFNEKITNIDLNSSSIDYKNGGQLYDIYPVKLRRINFKDIFIEDGLYNELLIYKNDKSISLKFSNERFTMSSDILLLLMEIKFEDENKDKFYSIEINCIEELKI